MSDDLDESPRPFRRSRNLSNRNFSKRRTSTLSVESRSSVETDNSLSSSSTSKAISQATDSSSSHLDISYSVNSDTENGFRMKSMRRMYSISVEDGEVVDRREEQVSMEKPANRTSETPDPALMGVKQKVQRFEVLHKDGRKIPILPQRNEKFLPRLLNITARKSPPLSEASARRSSSSRHTSIDEEKTEDEIDNISDFDDDDDVEAAANEEEAITPKAELQSSQLFDIDNYGKVKVQRRNASLAAEGESPGSSAATTPVVEKKTVNFPRNFRTVPRPKTEIVGTSNRVVIGKYSSFNLGKESDSTSGEETEEEIQLRSKYDKHVLDILTELIRTEESYTTKLCEDIRNYGSIFERDDLPVGLKGKKYVLLGNIEQIAEFHRDEFLPMLYRNQRDLKGLFDEFLEMMEQNCFYGYVIYTMGKKRSLKLCDVYKNYFKLIQLEFDDKLGINSFLVQPIQRIARYPLLMNEFLKALFKKHDMEMKPLIDSCCRLERKIRQLLTISNESESINDIVDCNEFNVFYQGKFQRVSEFSVYDHTHKRTYRSKVFIFDKCIIYTEIKSKNHLIFRGRYPCEHIGIFSHSKLKFFTLFYEQRKKQECDFYADPSQIEMWLELIGNMISAYAKEERLKLQERYSRESDHLHRKVTSLSLYRDSNRFSSDSGIGNIWTMPKPEVGEDACSNRSTWYAIT